VDICVTGGNGYLGRHLVSSLRERGDSVRVLALPTEDTTWLEEQDVAVFRGDVRSADALTAPMRGAHGVFHLAAMMGTWRSMRDYRAVNVTGTANVCRAALQAGASRLIHISSAMVYDMAVGRPVTEDDALAPLHEPYSLTKAAGDQLVQRMMREQQLPAVIIRPGTLIGPGDHLNFGRMADRIRAGKGIIIGDGENALPLLYISDMVQALLLALDSAEAVGAIYNVGNDQPVSQVQYLSLIAQEIGVAPPHIHVHYGSLYAAAYIAERVSTLTSNRLRPFLTRHGVKLYGANNRMSIDKARRELGYEPGESLPEAIRVACHWYQHQHGWTATMAPAGQL
jgi:nucleoside-diphosphate-sugar epimerase